MSTSLARIEANRLNAQLSTGPRTPEGKARAGLNAVRHGLRCDRVVLAGEDEAGYDALRTQLEAEHEPATALEVVLVDQLAQLAWKLRRLAETEAAMFEQMLAGLATGPRATSSGEAMLRDIKSRNPVTLKLQLYQVRIERAFYRAITELRRLKAERVAGATAAAAHVIRPNEPNARPKPRPGHGLSTSPAPGPLSRYAGGGMGRGSADCEAAIPSQTPSLTLPRDTGRGNQTTLRPFRPCE